MKKIQRISLGTLVVLLSIIGLTHVANAIDPVANSSQTVPTDVSDFNGFCASCTSDPN